MKKIFYFMSLAAVVFAMASCKDKETEPIPQGEEVVPQQIRLADAFQEYFMSDGESVELRYSVSPANVNVKYTLEWKTSDKSVVVVNTKGEATAQGVGEATITVSIPEYPDVKPAEAKITVLAPAKVGDYIYSDGSWGENPNPSGDKSVIAVVYWVGNASLFDPILEQDYPNCTHGLAMSLKQGAAGQWMKDFTNYYYNCDVEDTPAEQQFKTVANGPLCDESASLTEWGIKHSSYADKIRPYFENEDLWSGYYPGVGGYTYTAVLEQYTREYDPEGKFPFEFYINAMNLVKDIEAPLTTTRWYLPAIFEATLMVNTAVTKPGDVANDKVDDDMNPLVQHNNDNVAVVNAALQKVSGADLLPTESGYAIASATDVYCPFSENVCDYMSCGDFFYLFYVCQNPKGQDAETAAKYEKIWQDWLKENAPESEYEQYKAYTDYTDKDFEIADRYEIYLTIKGYNGPALRDKIGGSSLNWVLSQFVVKMYANVSTTTGKPQIFDPSFSSVYEYPSGIKGKDNSHDVVRAIIAF